MVVKSQIKLIRNLQQKKYRTQHGLFVVEGIKTVQELLNANFSIYQIYATDPHKIYCPTEKLEIISEADLKKISGLHTPNSVLGVFYISKSKEIVFADWIIALDNVRDPGNLGTIIRLCDWFGINHLICSQHTVDCYNPKVLQASMGSISRVCLHYLDLTHFVTETKLPVYGAFMDGSKVGNENLPKKGILIMGNEANGISSEIEALVHKKISISQYGDSTTESLNVATATAILLHELRRDT